MSSMLSRIFAISLLLTPATCIAADQFGDPSSWNPDDVGLVDRTGGNAQLALQVWRDLGQSDNHSFTSYARFLVHFPGWPDDSRMRRNAEQAIDINNFNTSQLLLYFNRLPPVTNGGAAKYAMALLNRGEREKANEMAKKAWRGGTLFKNDETALLRRFSSVLSIDDHDERMDALLWARATKAAARQIGFTSSARKTVFAARLALLNNYADADARANGVASIARDESGYLADRARYLRNKQRSFSARGLLAERPKLRVLPQKPETWYDAMLLNARAAANDRQWTTAYNIASKLDDAFPEGTDISKENLQVRDKYTSLAWLAGTTALYHRNRPQDAVGMFSRYGNAAQTPQTRSKGFYWAGRAAAEAGDSATATQYFEKAAQYPDFFYGQLSYERLGRALPRFNRAATTPITAADRAEFDKMPLVSAVKSVARTRNWRKENKFYRTMAFNAKTEKDYQLVADLAARIGKKDMGLIAAQSAARAGVVNIDAAAFPTLNLPPQIKHNWTMAHAITRQESQFAQRAISHANAYGLMQLLRGTAREQAGKEGIPYRQSALLEDPQYNMRLGSGYFERVRRQFGGSYPLAAAAYNAGPGRVRGWLRRYGDPRNGGIDWLRWIEQIPIFETRNYVQRVLENAVVYDTLNPNGPQINSDTPLTRYIGKNYIG